MSFTDQKPHFVTKDDLKRKWAGHRDNFRCYLCGHKFELDDTYRWVYNPRGLNFMVCKGCDGEDVIERFKKHYAEGEVKYWWFIGIKHRRAHSEEISHLEADARGVVQELEWQNRELEIQLKGY